MSIRLLKFAKLKIPPMKNDKKLLLVVDPQIDFISGTLPVPGAAEAMDKLAEYVAANASKYETCVVTADWHSPRHCSFAEQGGMWPAHCVEHSVGAAIYPKLYAALIANMSNLCVLPKGNSVDSEEYSVFKNEASAAQLDGIVDEYAIAQIDICGIAGNVCVLNTLADAVERYKNIQLNVLQEFAPSLDGGEKLMQAIKSMNL